MNCTHNCLCIALPSIVNAAIFTAALSAGNSYLFCASRILHGLAVRGQAPRFILYTTKNGLPIVAVIISVRSKFHFFYFLRLSCIFCSVCSPR